MSKSYLVVWQVTQVQHFSFRRTYREFWEMICWWNTWVACEWNGCVGEACGLFGLTQLHFGAQGLESILTWCDVMGRRVTWVLAELHLVKDLAFSEIFPLLFPLPVAVTVWGATGQKGVMFHAGNHTVAHIINKQVAKLPFPL